MPGLLTVEDIHTAYGLSRVLFGVSLEIAAGECVTLLGRNGVGKTTTMRSIMGLTPPASGRVLWKGEDVTGWPPHKVARAGIGFVPEDRRIFAELSVWENLDVAGRAGGRRGHWTVETVYELFQVLCDLSNRQGGFLSGGEQQMLTIGRALMTNPEIILLDEATEGLAPKLRDEIWATLREIAAAGIAAVVVDKNLADLLEFCDRHVVMAKGEIVFDGPGKALAADQALIHRNLGV
jgi:branched-chain amino acid transport system ATP-binding protein